MTSYLKSVLGYRALAYLVLAIFTGVFSHFVIFEGSPLKGSEIFFLFSMAMFTNSLSLFLKFEEKTLESTLFAFLLADAAIVMLLVRSSGSSASPYLVLFPMMTLGGAVVFRGMLSFIFSAANFIFMSLGVGFGMAIVGNGLAILLTSVLGMYLVRALDLSGKMLKVSEGARRRLENLQKAILTNIPSGLMSVDAQGKVIQVNRIGLKILGRSENEILSCHIRDLLPEIADKIFRLNTEVPVLGEDPMQDSPNRKTVKYLRQGEGELNLGYSIARLSDPLDKSPLGTLVVFQDLTKILRLEESLRLSEKLAAVGKLAAGIAHEIRNPLAGISGSAQLLHDSEELSQEDKKLLSIIQRESTRLDSLITEFLEYVRPAKPRFEVVSLAKVVTQVVDSLKVNQKWAKLGCEVELKLGGGDLKAWGDPNKITQVLMNLLMNAAQADSKRIQVRLLSDATHAVVEIWDDGKGISPENQAHLFEPFFTTKEAGTGLGLAISYRVLESMRAYVSVRSPLPEFCARGGTLFRLEFLYPEEETRKKSA